jgi:hypothetical protein
MKQVRKQQLELATPDAGPGFGLREKLFDLRGGLREKPFNLRVGLRRARGVATENRANQMPGNYASPIAAVVCASRIGLRVLEAQTNSGSFQTTTLLPVRTDWHSLWHKTRASRASLPLSNSGSLPL